MRIEIAGAQITDAVVEVLDTLQNEPGVADSCILAIDAVTRNMISGDGLDDDTATFKLLRGLQRIRRGLLVLAAPPDADSEKNDKPLLSL